MLQSDYWLALTLGELAADHYQSIKVDEWNLVLTVTKGWRSNLGDITPAAVWFQPRERTLVARTQNEWQTSQTNT